MASAVAATDDCKMQDPPLATVYFIVKKAPYSLAEIAPQGVDRPSDNSGTVRDTPQEDGGVLDHTLPATLATEGPDTEVGQAPPPCHRRCRARLNESPLHPLPRISRRANCPLRPSDHNQHASANQPPRTFRLAPNNPQVNRAMLYRLTIAALIVSASAFAPTDQCKARSTLPVPYHSTPQN